MSPETVMLPDVTYEDWPRLWIRWDIGDPDWPADEFPLEIGTPVEITTRGGSKLFISWSGGKTIDVIEVAE